jgi:hypothetical protein
MFGRPSLRDLFAEMREESKRRDEESKRRDEESQRRDKEAKRRDQEFKRREDEFKGLVEETREYNREILLRNEKVYTTVVAEMQEATEQIRANTQAVLSLLDRFNDSDGLAA